MAYSDKGESCPLFPHYEAAVRLSVHMAQYFHADGQLSSKVLEGKLFQL